MTVCLVLIKVSSETCGHRQCPTRLLNISFNPRGRPTRYRLDKDANELILASIKFLLHGVLIAFG